MTSDQNINNILNILRNCTKKLQYKLDSCPMSTDINLHNEMCWCNSWIVVDNLSFTKSTLYNFVCRSYGKSDFTNNNMKKYYRSRVRDHHRTKKRIESSVLKPWNDDLFLEDFPCSLGPISKLVRAEISGCNLKNLSESVYHISSYIIYELKISRFQILCMRSGRLDFLSPNPSFCIDTTSPNRLLFLGVIFP